MCKIKSLAMKMRKFFSSEQFTTNKEGADIIRRFVKDAVGPYEWDDFESVNQSNPDVDIAINLCWYYAAKFPAKNKNEYCGSEAVQFFLRIADALQEGRFAGLDRVAIKCELQTGRLPDQLRGVVDIDAGGNGDGDRLQSRT